MTEMTDTDDEPILRWLRLLGWGTAGLLLLAPLVAMQIGPDSGVNWTLSDFIFAAFLLGGVGLAAELAVRFSNSWTYRIAAALGLAAGFFLLWTNAAVGYIGDDNPLNIAFVGVVALAFAGSLVARFRPRGMAIAMTAAGIAHFIAGAIGFPQDPITGPITLVFTAMWLTSAWLFGKSAREGQGR